MRVLQVTTQDEGQRLDRLLAKYMQLAPRSFLYKMLRKKNIKLNGKRAEGSEKLCAGDEITLYLADDTVDSFRKREDKDAIPQRKRVSLDVVFEDEDILVINKPVGMLSQKADKSDLSLVEYLSDYLSSESQISYTNPETGFIQEQKVQGAGSVQKQANQGTGFAQEQVNQETGSIQKRAVQGTGSIQEQTFRPGICNRLDRNTSGLVVAGKTVRGLQWMNQLFRERDLKKYYLCIVKGKIETGRHINGYLLKNGNHNTVTVSVQPVVGAEPIETEYEPLQGGFLHGEEYTLLKVHLITGKSHQIRAHLQSIGSPIVGDGKYGRKDMYHLFKREFGIKYQQLHAWRLELGEAGYLPEKYCRQQFSAPPPRDFLRVMEGLGMHFSDQLFVSAE